MKCNNDEDRFHYRKHLRLKQFDYSTSNYYFVTICTWSKACIFGADGRLNSFGMIAQQGIEEIQHHFSNASIDKFVVMPNHVHMIVVIQGEGASLTTIVGQYKSFVSRKIRERKPYQKVWQTSFHDHVIRNQAAYEKIWLYIEANPKNWEKDCFLKLNKDRTWPAGS